MSHFVVGAAGSQGELAECCLEHFTDELRFLVVEADAILAVHAVLRALGELRVAVSLQTVPGKTKLS